MFIREQIRKLEVERGSSDSLGVFTLENDKVVRAHEDREKERRVALDEKIARYQAALGPGACKQNDPLAGGMSGK